MKRLLPLLMLATAMAASAIAATGRLEVKDLSDTIAWGHDTTGMRNTCQMIVVHSNYYAGRDRSQWDLQGCIAQLRQYDVAPHYMIDRQGTLYRLTPDSLVAWHAGESVLPGDTIAHLNYYSLGIEVINSKRYGPTNAQYRQLAHLINTLCDQYDITHLMGHSDIAPQRKSDPWAFSWKRLEGLLNKRAMRARAWTTQ